jgi:hypothetical protein
METLSKIILFFSRSGTLFCGHVSKALNFLYIKSKALSYMASIVWISFEKQGGLPELYPFLGSER